MEDPGKSNGKPGGFDEKIVSMRCPSSESLS
jgi:hypothetical protein